MRQSARLGVLCGAGSAMLVAACASACPTDTALSASILHGSPGACLDPSAARPCSDIRSGTSTLDSGGRGGPPVEVSIVDFSFLPNAPVIKPNTTVRWTNTGLFTHTSTRSPTWNSGFLNPNQFFDFTFTTASAGLSYHYDCSIHGLSFGMEGDINVALFGDANLDTIVNLQDFNILAANFGRMTGAAWENGDFNEDGVVGLADFNLLAGSFGREILPAGFVDISSFVPEPATTSMTLLLLPLVARRRR